ncbi:lactosylceramide 4-alpha-galactosyltransferase-like [Sitodiplosis mosellana]|uniref:lactosylceramide 4-alpha-galactosyltransferase-like n=1 Tax=Sitodiplosis mosellana TaxID=263140 RepID=UPI0024438CFB|nr:lactosylceramide 4-alpha-galactosyltransferase-like [Sitodiplosis mosellana]
MSDKMLSRFHCRRKRIYLLCLCFALCFVCLFFNTRSKNIAILKTCFIPTLRHRNDNITLFEDILEAEKKPTADRSVFFIESSCVRNGLAALTARQACAVESAARRNPNRDIFVLFPAQVGFSELFSSSIMHSLRLYRNIYFRRVNYQNYGLSTPAETLLQSDRIFQSSFLTETLSDILRFVTLHRFGGIYLDTDTIVQQNLDVLPHDFAGAESDSYIANGVLGFSSQGLGHDITGVILKDICDEFNPSLWGHNGPDAITRTLKRICNVNDITKMKPEICWRFHVLPKRVLYPVNFLQWKRLFDPSQLNETLRITKDAVAVHFWNKLTSSTPILKNFKNKTAIEMYTEKMTKHSDISNPFGGETAYGFLAKTNCPLVYNASVPSNSVTNGSKGLARMSVSFDTRIPFVRLLKSVQGKSKPSKYNRVLPQTRSIWYI